ncbi:MAG: carboxypeptidase regulatory-like domain-containing protein [Cyanobacteria bacterium]|nr:carboxypeptidase regulatory-like domain-containing protein [Cyanobacteriota bacterium]
MRNLVCLAGAAVLLAGAAPVFAQSSGIAGLVKDASGGVLPGVTVEASSPALIERSRAVVTDSQGRYNIVDLRPGVYTVTFTLTGFSSVRRAEIQLPAAFTAQVNADLKVGALEETITVTGESPLVDTSNVIKRQVVSSEVIDAMPTSKNWSTLGVLTVGVFSNQNDVGGSAGEHQNQLKAHGGSFNDRIVQLDGLMIANMACNYACTGISTNDASTQELSYEFGAISAETGGGGVRVNVIPREGGNRFSGQLFANYANSALQTNNVDDTLRAQGVTTADSINRINDTSFAFGGPLKKDKLWFWTAHRFWGYEQIRTNTFYEGNPNDFVFDPDRSRPGTETQKNGSLDLRLTWQMSPKNKLSGYYNYAPRRTEHWTLVSTIQPDASNLQNLPVNHFETLTFRSTVTSRMLFEAAAGNMTEIWTREPVADSTTSKGYPVTEQTTGINFRAYAGLFSRNYTSLRSYRSALSYVTGSHAFKLGFTLQEGPAITDVYTSYDTALTVRLGQPFQVTVRTTPYTARERLVADLGIFAQDTWTIKRLTANLGVRWDYLNNKVEAQSAAGGTWIGPRSFPAMTNVPNYKDIAPRLGMAYDVFGNGKTAAKVTLSRYIVPNTVAVARQLNPFNTSVNAATRPWTDANNDGIPQVTELGALSNNAFGQLNVATRFDPDTINGFGKRRNNWEVSAGVTQELMSRLSVDLTYYRRAQGNFTTTDNLDVAPTDFEPYCVTAPRDPRLPDGGGQQICGLYDIVPAKFGVATNNLVVRNDKLGVKQKEVFDGVDVAFSARMGRGVFLNGGVASGRTRFNQCQAYVDNPAQTFGLTGATFAYCDYTSGLLTQAKLNGSYTLPWQQIQVAGVLQNLPGQQILAQWNITQAEVAGSQLGRALSGGANTSRVVPLIKPGTMFTPRRTQIDLRVSKAFRIKEGKRLQVMADVFNLTNSNAAVGATSNAGEPPAALITTFGSAWLRPLNVLQARYVKFGAQLTF